MNYLSFSFLGFVAVVLLLFYLVPQKVRPYVLLCGSIFFYCCFTWKYLPFLLFVAVSTFFAAKYLAASQRKKLLLILCIVANMLVWFVVKDLQWMLFIGKNILSLVGLSFEAPFLWLLVPVGISYYTLQAIAYLVDVSRGRVPPEKNFLHYLLFLCYFPTIVQGPISRYDQLMPQLLNPRPLREGGRRESLLLVLLGIVKKMVIADRLAPFVNTCFEQFSELHGMILYLGAVGYALQLYFDFSGCVDICRGVSGLFGIELAANFNRPYLARSVKEFWQKWHLSLSNWLKDYIYIPLGGNRLGTTRKYLNLLATFLISGLWHGAGMQFLLWGLLHGLYQIIGQATQGARQKLKTYLGIRPGSFSERVFQTLITFHLITLGWIFFRSDNIASAFAYIGNIFVYSRVDVLFNNILDGLGFSTLHVGVLLLNIYALFSLECRTTSQKEGLKAFFRQHILLRWPVYLALFFDILLFGAYGSGYSTAGFMYGGF